MDTKKEFDGAINKWNLLKSPFYAAWSSGTLSVEDLRTYTSEYGAFISMLPMAWKTLDDKETEHEEEEHHELWEKFGKSIGAIMSSLKLPNTLNLVSKAKELFADKASSIGALYAFEAQQPATAQSKLKGLREHYSSLNADEEYFKIHSHNEHEAEKLLKMSEKLSADDKKVAVSACSAMSELLRKALDGMYTGHMVNC